jgi:hypothetical protein
VFRFVRLLDDDPEFRDELGARSRSSRRMIVARDSGAGTQQLTPDRLRFHRRWQRPHKANDPNRKALHPLAKLLSLAGHAAQRARAVPLKTMALSLDESHHDAKPATDEQREPVKSCNGTLLQDP